MDPNCTHVFIDSEFLTDDFTPGGLVSTALVWGTERYYAVNADMNVEELHRRPWMVENVWKFIPSDGNQLDTSHPDVKPYEQIRDDASEFFEQIFDSVGGDMDRVRLIAKCGGQDEVRLHGLWNHDWIDTMPRWIPNFRDDTKRIVLDSGIDKTLLPVQDPATCHHPLHDAVHEQTTVEFVRLTTAMDTITY